MYRAEVIQGSETPGGLIKCETCETISSVNRGNEISMTLIKVLPVMGSYVS